MESEKTNKNQRKENIKVRKQSERGMCYVRLSLDADPCLPTTPTSSVCVIIVLSVLKTRKQNTNNHKITGNSHKKHIPVLDGEGVAPGDGFAPMCGVCLFCIKKHINPT